MNRVRCAIYTRKSSEEGLEQGFNSLDAQREACAAYVLSQASEGWTLIADAYDDGGISGGTLERPALQRLLADIEGGRIDIVVVYKVDRLTRALLDFAKLVETFDRAGVSFVSITQSFNTTTSMGRLTLNMLLSFAQFEREVTAERIRDKIAASKARGMWMGGTPPLGYRPDGRSLAVVEDHADLIRHIYARYLALGNVRRLAEELIAQGIRTPRRQRGTGTQFGGVPFTRGQLYAILKNAIYTGRIVHKDQVHAGLHPAIIAQATWDAVQQQLADHVRGHRRHREASGSLLAGKLVDARGEPLIASHASKGQVRYRYYVSRDRHDGGRGGIRMPAREIESLVTTRVAALFGDPLALLERIHAKAEPASIAAIGQRCAELAAALKGSRRQEIPGLLGKVQCQERSIVIELAVPALADLIGADLADDAPPTLTLTEPVRLTRTGRVVRLVDGAGCAVSDSAPDAALIKMIARARRWWGELASGTINIDQLAAQEQVTASWMTRVLRLAFLSPAVTEAVLAGTLKAGIASGALIQPGAIPAGWEEQRKLYLP